MKNYFTAFMLLGLLSAFTGCETAEPIDPEADRRGAADTTSGGWFCLQVSEVGVDTIRKGGYLGFTIGEKASRSHTVMQNLWQQKKISWLTPIYVVAANLAQLEKTLPVYNLLSINQGDYRAPAVSFTLEAGKVKSIHTEQSSLPQWPTAEPASMTIRVGDPVETVYPKLVALREESQYADYFNTITVSQHDVFQGYDPAMASLPEWTFCVPTGAGKGDEIILKFRQGTLATIVVRHLIYF